MRAVFMTPAGALCAALMCASAGAAPLRDPFARPPVVVAPAADAAAAPAEPPWQPQLRAIVYDGPRSLVNISGTILAVGDSVRGYRLVSAQEHAVVLAFAGKTIKLKLDNLERLP